VQDAGDAIKALCLIVGDQRIAERLIYAHGSRWPRVLGATNPEELQLVTSDAPYLTAEVLHAVDHEFTVTLADLLIRRMPLAFEQSDHGVAAATRIAGMMAERFGWSASDVTSALREYEEAVERMFAVV